MSNENSDMAPPRMEAFMALSDRVNTEIETYWSRNNVLLAVNVGILAFVFVSAPEDILLKFLIVALGIMAAIIWLLIVIRGR